MNGKKAIDTFRKHFHEPLKSIKENPYEFIVWWVAANVFGLAGFWLPLLLCMVQGMDVHKAFFELINAGALPAFGVVLLIEGLAGIWVVRGTGTNFTAVGIRGLVSMMALIVAVVQVSLLASQGMLAAQGKLNEGSNSTWTFQLVLTGITILFASYLFCFRFGKWEKGVEDYRRNDDKTAEQLAIEASQMTSEGTTKL